MPILTLAIALLIPLFNVHAADENGCETSFVASQDFVPTEAHRARLIERILARCGPDQTFDGVDSGNCGMHAYLIPHARTAHVFDVLAELLGPSVGGLRERYDPPKNMIVGVLETDDEPQITVVLMAKDAGEPYLILPRKFNAVDGEDTKRMRELVPGAWSAEGYYEHFHVTYDILKDAEEVDLPWTSPDRIGRWDIEDYR